MPCCLCYSPRQAASTLTCSAVFSSRQSHNWCSLHGCSRYHVRCAPLPRLWHVPCRPKNEKFNFNSLGSCMQPAGNTSMADPPPGRYACIADCTRSVPLLYQARHSAIVSPADHVPCHHRCLPLQSPPEAHLHLFPEHISVCELTRPQAMPRATHDLVVPTGLAGH